MAFLVCFTTAEAADWTEKAVYLPQEFYESVFELCRDDPRFALLSEIAAMRYEDEKLIRPEQLRGLRRELMQAERPMARMQHSLESFRIAVEIAIDRGVGLAIAGDMHPVLGTS